MLESRHESPQTIRGTEPLFSGLTDRAGTLALGQRYPDQQGAIVRHGAENGLELVKARLGMPLLPGVLKTQRDPSVTKVRHLLSRHWRRWLRPAHRYLVPLTSFTEPVRGGNQWFAPADPDAHMFFASIEVCGWTSVRKVKDGETTDDLFAF